MSILVKMDLMKKVNALKSLKNALDIVKNTDQDKNLVWFYQSY